jgi:D-alanyl-lipoteichoic acid acyltransferase DltB (MBOAT superfamily)
MTWMFNLTVLVIVSSVGESWELPYLTFRGMSGWSHMFNMLMLKQISFGVDVAHKSSNKTGLLYYLGYCFYSPLFLAGPIMSYSSWVESLSASKLSRKYIGLYGLRWLLTFFLLEGFLHLSYANAISAQRSVALNQVDSVSFGVSLSIAVLLFMWLKFLLIWRFFRFWSLLNGIDCPENMNRCVFNNYSMVQFWKDWHSSFNLWLIKYVYIPLGGSRRNRLFNILIVFTFVALWHDLTWRVFHWAFLVVAIMAPELVCTAIYRTHMKTFRQRFPLLGKIVKSIFATFNTQMLVLANMVGYVFGLEGVQTLIGNIKSYDLTDLTGVFVALYSMVTWMLWFDNRRILNKKTESRRSEIQ